LIESKKNILDGFRYFQNEVKEIQEEERAMRKLKDKYLTVQSDQSFSAKEELEDVAEDDSDWNIDLMANIRSLRSSVNNFVNSAGQW